MHLSTRVIKEGRDFESFILLLFEASRGAGARGVTVEYSMFSFLCSDVEAVWR